MQLRRVGRHNQHVGVRLDQDARLALVGFAQAVAGFHSFGHALFEVGRGADAPAIRAGAAKIRQPVRLRRVQAVEGLGEHQGKRVFARPARSGKDQRMRESRRAQALAQVPYRLRIAEKFLEAHGLSLVHHAREVPFHQCPAGVPLPAMEKYFVNRTSGAAISVTTPITWKQSMKASRWACASNWLLK